MSDADFELRLYRATDRMRLVLQDARDVKNAVRYALHTASELLEARAGCVAVLAPGRERADLLVESPPGTPWDLDRLTTYIQGDHRGLPSNLYLGTIHRKQRPWGAVVLRDPPAGSVRRYRSAVRDVARVLSEVLEGADRRRVHEVRERIERKMMDQIDPKDLLYTILHGLRSLTRYDHSSSLLVCRSGSDHLELAAEQIAWKKGKSRRIGTRIPIDGALRERLARERVRVLDRGASGWSSPEGPDPLGALLDTDRSPGIPEAGVMIVAPFSLPDGTLGVLRVLGLRSRSLGAFEANLVDGFVPQASMALQVSLQRETYHARLVDAERRQEVGNIARGIAHDVNNALASVLLLLQQTREDLRGTPLAGSPIAARLESSERSVQTCRRIFDGMLTVSKGAGRGSVGHGNLRRALESAAAILSESLLKRHVDLVVELPDDVPSLRCGQGDLTSVLLNIFTNARDAMPDGGTLAVRAERKADRMAVTVRDTGCGMPPEALARAGEPFFTTKPDGTGLGLSICQSILTDLGGSFLIESVPGEGTIVSLTIPVAGEAS